MFAVVVSLLLVALVNAQDPKPCETPAVWNALQMSFVHSEGVAVFGKLSYDANSERLSIEEMVYLEKEKERKFYKYIMLYEEKTLYQIENETQECLKKDLLEPFRKFKIPDNATAMRDLTIGSNALPGIGVDVVVWAGKTPAGDSYYATVTEKECVPIAEGLLSKKYGYIKTSFFNVELGVDPETFVPPESCKDAADKEIHLVPFF